MALRLNLDAVTEDVDPPTTEGIAGFRFLRLRYRSFEKSLCSELDLDNDEEAKKTFRDGLVLIHFPRICYFTDVFWWRCIVLPLIFANAVIVAAQLTFPLEPSRGTCIANNMCADFHVFKFVFFITMVIDIVMRPAFGRKYDWTFLNVLEFLIAFLPVVLSGFNQHSYLYDCSALLLLTTLLGPRRYWRSFSAFMEFHDALRVCRCDVPGLKVVSDSFARFASISSLKLSTQRLRSAIARLQNETEQVAFGLEPLHRPHEEEVPSNGAWLAEEEYAEPALRNIVNHFIIGYRTDTDCNVWSYVPGSETGWAVTSELLWVVAAARFIHHMLSGRVAVTEAAFQEAVQLRITAVEFYAKLLGLPPSSLTSLCGNARCDKAGTFDASALLTALVELAKEPVKNFIVTVELCPADSEECPLTDFRVCATSIAGEAKYVSVHESGAHFGDLKEKIRFEFGIGPNWAIEGLSADGTLLRNSDKLPDVIMNANRAAADELV